MADKIGFDEFQKMLLDPDVPDERIAEYAIVTRGASAFAPELHPNPDLVAMTEEEQEFESAMKIGNALARFRRQRRFKRRVKAGENLPILVSEGDSWFQFPILIRETIDQLGDAFLIWSVGAAGDTLENMVHGPVQRGGNEYMRALREQPNVRAFLFSAAGNDIIGEDPATGRPALQDILKPFNGDPTDVVGHVNIATLGTKLSFLRDGYRHVIRTVRSDPPFADLPIVIHGYDYAIPYPAGGGDTRDPKHAAKDAWLGRPMNDLGILDPNLRRNLTRFLIDALYEMLDGIASEAEFGGVHLVDCRGALPQVSDWADEIHGTSAGFAKVAERFRTVLNAALV